MKRAVLSVSEAVFRTLAWDAGHTLWGSNSWWNFLLSNYSSGFKCDSETPYNEFEMSVLWVSLQYTTWIFKLSFRSTKGKKKSASFNPSTKYQRLIQTSSIIFNKHIMISLSTQSSQRLSHLRKTKHWTQQSSIWNNQVRDYYSKIWLSCLKFNKSSIYRSWENTDYSQNHVRIAVNHLEEG